MDHFTNTPDTSASYTPTDIESNKVMAVLAYISFLVLIPLFAAKDSPYARYHTNQGLVLFLLSMACGVICSLISSILAWIPIIGWIMAFLISIIEWAIGIVTLVLMILGIINAATGKAKELPIIGSLKILK